MNHDFDEELEHSTGRRSRRDPNSAAARAAQSEREKWEQKQKEIQRQSTAELDVLGDKSVHPIPVNLTGAAEQEVKAKNRPIFKGTGAGAARPAAGSRPTAGTASGAGGGLPPRAAAELTRRKKRRRMITMIIAECIALVFIFGYGFFARTMAKLQRDDSFEISEIKTNDIDVQAVEAMKGYWTIAVFGVDSRDNTVKKGTNADVNLICNINRDTGEIKLVSVFRDTYLNISESSTYNKINQAYFLGGPEQAVQALNRNLDLHIQDYMTFNWKAVADAINILGGVDVELSKAEFYYINSFITETVKATGIGSHQLKQAGMNHLDGVQAVAYGRLRLMDTDYARTERQRKIISLAFEKAKKADAQTLYNVIGAVFPQVSTSIWVDDLVSNARNISKFHLGETTGFPQARGDANMGKKGAVVVPQTLESNVVKLHEFLFGIENYVPSSTVKNISSKISADTGMYREGQYVDKVSTEGGVIQPPKATSSAKKATEEDDNDEDAYEYVYVIDANGKKVKKRVEKETDEDGEYITRETDEDGVVLETIKPTTSSRPTLLETDEFGDPIEPESENLRPGSTTESSGLYPGLPGESTTNRPGSISETTTARPGSTTETTAAGRPGSTTETTTAARPGTTTPTTAATRPGSTTETTAANRPGAVNETVSRPGAVTETTADGGPGSSAGGTQIQQFPGGGNAAAETTAAVLPGGPGSSDAGTSQNPVGVVAGPGQ